MSRTAVYSALVLRNRPSTFASARQESNSEVFMLTAEDGIIRATVFGGPKSKLRSHTAPYNSGQTWVYHDPVKDYRKVSDFDVHSWRPGLRELYERTMAAGGVAETVLSSHGGGGNWSQALSLATATLDALENANEELCPRLFTHFLWCWADFVGFQPKIGYCSNCGKETFDDVFWYYSHENSVLCESCVPENRALSPKTELCTQKSSSVSTLLKLNPGSRRWLSAVGALEPSLLHLYSMDNKSFNETKALTAAVMTGALGKPLLSWDW
jgi:DNA repair protein RecO (recombination protein O)